MEAVEGVHHDAEADAAAHGISHVMGFAHSQVVHNGQHIVDPKFQVVISRIVGFVTAAVTSGVHHDQPVFLLQPLHEAVGVPVFQTAGKAVLQH